MATKKATKKKKNDDQYIVLNDDTLEYGPGPKAMAEAALADLFDDSSLTPYGDVTQTYVDEAIENDMFTAYKVTKVHIGAEVNATVKAYITVPIGKVVV